MPILYVVMLMLIHVRATYVFHDRYLYPVVPLSCFLGAAAFHYLGIDEIGRRDLSSPRFFLPVLALAFLVFGIVMPYQAGWISADEFLPAAWLASIQWSSLDAFVRLVAAPVLVLALTLGLILSLDHRRSRVLFAVGLLLLLFGKPFSRTLWELRTHRPWQRGETNLHALRVLGDEIEPSDAWINVSPSLMAKEYRMFGKKATCQRIVLSYLRRPVRVTCWPTVRPEHDLVFLTSANYDFWLEKWPALAGTAVASPAGEVVIVRPPRAGEPPAGLFEPASASGAP
jgi:hypothetical protein